MSVTAGVDRRSVDTDPLVVGGLGDRDAALRAVARIAPAVSDRARSADIPHPETFADIKEAGLPAYIVPAEFGGGGADLADASAIVRALAAADASAALVLTMHYIHTTRLLGGSTTPALSAVAQRLASDNLLLNFAASESRSGAPSRGGTPETTAVRTLTGWELNGRKRYVTGSIGLDLILVTAHVQSSDEAGVHTFVVPAASPGVRIEETWDTFGLRGTASHDVILDGVVVAVDAAATAYDPNTNVDRSDTFYNWWSLLLASVHVGIATAARATALDFASGSRNDGHPGARYEQPRTRAHAAALELALLQAETLLHGGLARVGRDGGGVAGLGPAVKLLVHRHATDAVDAATRLVGGASVWNSSDLSRFHRDLRVAMFNPPNDDVVADRVADIVFQAGGGTLLADAEGHRR